MNSNRIVLGKYDGHEGATVAEHLAWVRSELEEPWGPLLREEPTVVYLMHCYQEALERLQLLEQALTGEQP